MKTTHLFLLLGFGLFLYVQWSGDARYSNAPRKLNYDVMAVSEGLTAEAQALDLADNLDVAVLPEIGKQAIREAARLGLREQAFLEHVLREVSDRVREISTIDLNADGTADPVLVRPEPGGEQSFVMLTLQVPAPAAYPLPKAGDAEAWRGVETVEVATLTVSLNAQELAVEARGNEHVYPGAAERNYTAYDRSPSFLQTYVAIRMVDWLFFPSPWGFYRPGWGYGGYRPMRVPDVATGRNDTLRRRGYERAATSSTPTVRGRSGAAPRSRYEKATAGKPPRALRDLKASRRFQSRAAGSSVGSSAGKGGFGRSRSAASPAPSRRYATPGGSSRSRAFGRVSPRRSGGFGGFGRRGFRMRGFRLR